MSELGFACIGFAIGWWMRAVCYKRGYLLRTNYEWWADDRVRRRYGDKGDLDDIRAGAKPINDANLPWWTP